MSIFLGYEVPSATAVHIPLHHLVITGMTQLSGKTTTIEALIHRSNLRAVVFKTKRGEQGFESAGRTLPLYFKERSDWQYVSSLIEATLRERVKFERSWVIRACKGTKSLDEVYARVVDFLNKERLRALDKSVFTNLQAYLELILPEIKKLPTTDKIEIGSGVNVMDLEDVYNRPEVQALVIRSVMEHILENERDIIVVVPECWKFLPQGRNTPVKVFFERFIREGATIGNYLWLDSQDIAGVDKTPLRQVDNWILGRQREEHEVDRTIEAIPLPRGSKPSSLQIRRLKLGHFYAACGDDVKLVYVMPVGIEDELAKQVAMGEISPLEVKETLRLLRLGKETNDLVWKEKYEELKKRYEELEDKLTPFENEIKKLQEDMEDLKTLEEWKAEYGGKFDETEKQIKKLKAEHLKTDKKLTQALKDRHQLQGKLKEAEEELKLLQEFRNVFAKIVPTPTVDMNKILMQTTDNPSKLSISLQQPEISVNVERNVLELTDKKLLGKLSILYAEGEFGEDWFSISSVTKTFEKHAWKRDPRVSKFLDDMVRWNFFEKRFSGRRPEYKVKLSPEEAKAKGLIKTS